MNGIMRSFMCTFLSPTRSSSDEKQKVSENKRKKSESLSPPKAKAARHRSVSSSSAHRYDGDNENIYFIENLHSVYPLNAITRRLLLLLEQIVALVFHPFKAARWATVCFTSASWRKHSSSVFNRRRVEKHKVGRK